MRDSHPTVRHDRAVVVRPIIVKTPRVYQRRKNDPRQNERRTSCHVSDHVGRKCRQRKEPCSVNTHIFGVNIDRIRERLMLQEQLRGVLLLPQDDNEVGRSRYMGTKESRLEPSDRWIPQSIIGSGRWMLPGRSQAQLKPSPRCKTKIFFSYPLSILPSHVPSYCWIIWWVPIRFRRCEGT